MFLIILVFINFVLCGAYPDYLGHTLQEIFRSRPENEKIILKLAIDNGYSIEEHQVTTSDGYILKLHRLRSDQQSCVRKVPVYVLHGLFGNADAWLVNGPGRALGYVLADEGYDVWLGNARGTTHSRQHKELDPQENKFWEFSWHEIGVFDNPAVIDYILSETNQPTLHYIGHSQGTTTFFVMASMRPEYNAKIKTVHALSPVAYMKDQTSLLFSIPALFLKPLELLARNFGFSELLPNTWLLRLVGDFLCTRTGTNICKGIQGTVGGFNRRNEDPSIYPQYLDVVPAGASMFQLLHYSQGVVSGEFLLYDFGEKGNLERYNLTNPPEYPLESINASSIFLYVSGNDYISTIPDIQRLIKRLPNNTAYIEVEDKNFSHIDYIFGKFAKEFVFDKVIEAIKKSDGDKC